MRKLRTGIFIETRYEGVILGAIPSEDGLLLVDCPLHTESVQEWLAQLAQHGQPRYMVLLDYQPDRVLGARVLDIPIIAHDKTLHIMRDWPDVFKGSSKPIGAESDHLKRITGVSRAVPNLAFSDEMIMHMGEREIHLMHRPGPTPGSAWVLVPDAKIAFIGDTVAITQPAYLGEADIDQWLERLDELRSPQFNSYRIVSARDGLVNRDQINRMARFLRKIPIRLSRLASKRMPAEAAAGIAPQLARDFQVSQNQRDIVLQRLRAGLKLLYMRSFSKDS
jgi:glyoxylase-like metal-dependent hydrolase (beta-lactamase superfamily II)